MSELRAYGSAHAAITSRLARGEKLIWSDRPRPKLLAQRELNFGFFVGIFFFGFALFWMSMASQAGAFALFGIPFVAVGLWIVSGPLRAYYRAANLVFALTDRRALIVSRNEVKSYPLEQIDFVDTKSFADGSGHVYFHKEPTGFSGWPSQQPGALQNSGFLAVAKAEQVAATLLELIEKRRSSRPEPPASMRG
jgi:hypothetical protein